MLFIAVSFLAGNMLLHSQSDLPGITSLLTLPILLGFKSQKFLLHIAAAFAAGFLVTWFAAYLQLQATDEFDGGQFQATIRVDSIPIKKVTHWQFIAAVLDADAPIPAKLRLSVYEKEADLYLGNVLQGELRLKPVSGYLNPGGFDYEKYLFMRGIGATGYIKNWHLVKHASSSFKRLRNFFYQHLSQHTLNNQHAGLFFALAMGERGKMKPMHWDLLQATGVGHLFAISGLHIGLIFGAFFFILQAIWKHFFLCRFGIPVNTAAALAALLPAACYAWFAGFSIPTQRALVMLCCLVIGRYWLRRLALSDTLAWAILIVLLLDPMSSLSISFWFSFLAVASIALYLNSYPTIRRRWIGLYIYIPCALLPISILFFQHGSLIAPFANLIAIPYIGFILLPVCFLATLFVPINEMICGMLVQIADYLFEFFIIGARYLELIDYFQWFHRAPLWAYFSAIIGVIAVAVLSGIRKKIIACILLLSLTAVPEKTLTPGNFRVDFLDVGQGLSILIETAKHRLLFDVGAAYASGFDLGRAVVVPYLRYHNIKVLDMLIISHGDNDHAGGATAVMDKMTVKKKYLGGGGKRAGFNHCIRGEQWHWDGVDFEFLHPPEESPLAGNNASCVLKISNAHRSLLLTADIETAAEKNLIAYYGEDLQADVVLVPHHGSLTSSTHAFVQLNRPDIAVVSSGFRNRFGFPKDEVMARFRQANAVVYNTADSGAISMVFDNNGQIHISEYRKKYRKYWHRTQ